MTTALNGEQNDHSNLALPNRDRLRGRPAHRNSRDDGDVMSTEYRVVPEELLKQCKVLAAMQGDGSTEHFKKLEALLAAPVPPTGVEPVAYADPMAFENFKYGKATHEWMWAKPDAGLCPVYSQATVTRVQTEVEQQKAISKVYIASDGAKDLRIIATERERDALKAEVERHKLQSHCHLQRAKLAESELTKVRELLVPLSEYATDSVSPVMRARAVEARKLLARQSAPAAKEGE